MNATPDPLPVDILDSWCRTCGARPGVPCRVRGVRSPADVRTIEDDDRRRAEIRARALSGATGWPVAELRRAKYRAFHKPRILDAHRAHRDVGRRAAAGVPGRLRSAS